LDYLLDCHIVVIISYKTLKSHTVGVKAPLYRLNKMGSIDEVQQLLELILQDGSISKNIREILKEIREELTDDKNIALKINAALQKTEDLSLDPNLNADIRTQLWNLATLLESAQRE